MGNDIGLEIRSQFGVFSSGVHSAKIIGHTFESLRPESFEKPGHGGALFRSGPVFSRQFSVFSQQQSSLREVVRCRSPLANRLVVVETCRYTHKAC